MNQVKGVVGNAMKSVETAVGGAIKVLGALGGALSVGMFTSLIRGTIDAADHLNDLNKSTDISIERLSGLRLLARQTGGDLDGMAASINKLSQNIGKDSAKFAKLGITAKDPLEALKQLADVYVAIEDPQLRAAVAAEALGKSWAGAAPALSEGGKRIGEIIEKGARLSGVTTQMAQQADELNDKWAELGGTGGFMTRMVAPMLPLLIRLTDDMLKAQEKSDALKSSFSPLAETLRTLVVLGGNFSYVFRTIGVSIAGVGAQIQGFRSGGLKGLTEARDMMKQILEDERKAFDQWERGVMTAGNTPSTSGGGPVGNAGSANAAARAFMNAEKHRAAAESAAKKEAAAYEQVRKSVSEMTAAKQAELSTTEQLSDAEKLALKIMVDLRDGALELNAAHRKQLGTDIERLLATDRDLKQRNALQAAMKAELELIERQIVKRDEFNESMNAMQRAFSEASEAMALETRYTQAETAILRTYGLTQAEVTKRLRELTIAKEIELRTDRLRREEREKISRLDGDDVLNFARQARSIMEETDRQIAELPGMLSRSINSRGVLDEVQKFNSEALRIRDSLNDGITDGLMRGFEKGKGFVRNFIDQLKSGFQSLVLRPVVQMVLSPVTGSVAATLAGMSGSASAASGGAGGGLGTLSNLGSLASSLFGSSSGPSAITSMVASGFQNAGVAFGSQAIADVGNLLVSGSGALGAIGTAMPYVAAAVAAYTLLKKKKTPASFSGGRLTGTASLSGFEGTLYGTSTSNPNNPLMNQWVNEDYGILDLLQKPVKGAFEEMRKLAEILKLDTTKLANVRASFDLTGVGQRGTDEVLPKFIENIGTLTDSIARELLPEIEDLRQGNESLTQTFARLAAEAKQLDEQMLAAHAEAVKNAQDSLREAYKTEASELQRGIEKWADLASRLREYGASLLGSQNGGMSYSAAAAQFAIVSAQARAGGAGAMAQLPSAGEAFRNAALTNAASALEYARDLAKIRGAVGDAAITAAGKASAAEQQLETLTQQVSLLVTINESVLSVEQAIAALADATKAAELYQQKRDDERAASAERSSAAALAALAVSASAGATATTAAQSTVGAAQFMTERLAAMQAWMNAMNGGAENIPRQFEPGMDWDDVRRTLEQGPQLLSSVHEQASPNATVERALTDMATNMAQIEANTRAAAQQQFESARMLRRWDGDGMPEVRDSGDE